MQIGRLTPEEYSEARKQALQEIEERNKEVNAMPSGGAKVETKKEKKETIVLVCAKCGKQRKTGIDVIEKFKKTKPDITSNWLCKGCKKAGAS